MTHEAGHRDCCRGDDLSSSETEPSTTITRDETVPRAIVFYDGICVLCSRTIRFLSKRDKKRLLTFATLQGDTARAILQNNQPDTRHSEWSVVFVRNAGGSKEEVFFRSTAILMIFDTLGGAWRMVSWLKVIPLAIRDSVYRWLARNRYKWFGQYNQCPVPEPEWRDRFMP